MRFIIAWLLIPPLAIAQSGLPLSSGILDCYVAKAKEQGKTRIEIPIGTALVANPEPLDASLNHVTIVLARPVAEATTHDKDRIYTWRKYHVLEKFSTQPRIPAGLLPSNIPPSLLPLGPGDFLVPEEGGQIELEGVTIVQRDPRRQLFAPEHRQLMYLMFRSSGLLGPLNYGTAGLFEVDDQDQIVACADPLSILYRELLERTGGKLATFREIADTQQATAKK